MAGITQKDTHTLRNCLISIVVPSNSNGLVQLTKQKIHLPYGATDNILKCKINQNRKTLSSSRFNCLKKESFTLCLKLFTVLQFFVPESILFHIVAPKYERQFFP